MSEELKELISQIPFGTEREDLPFMQGWAIIEVIKKYSIPAIAWGYYKDLIGVETEKQYIVWRDEGWRLVFLGLMNKECAPCIN
jgi:hypothetical protein